MPLKSLFYLLLPLIPALSPHDFGPIYSETDLSRFPVEPWNTYSNLAFLALLSYWAVKIGPHWRRHLLLATALPILALGFLGGTIYHATRSSRLWLVLDFGPIFILAALAAFYFWWQITRSAWLAGVLLCLPLVVIRGVAQFFQPLSHHQGIALGYGTLALAIIIPALLFCRLLRWQGGYFLALAFFSFGIAITARQLDHSGLLPMGTHFLWHLFGALATHFLIAFIYQTTPATTITTKQLPSQA